MKTQLNSNLFPIISVAMYGTFLDAAEMFDDYQINADFENGDSDFNASEFWERFNNQRYVKSIEKLAADFLDGQITAENYDFEITVKCGELYSPKFYNFANDQIELDVEFDRAKVLQIIAENENEFNQFLKENYSSYDGFISHTANNLSQWYNDFADENVQAIGAVLTFLFQDEIKENDENLKFYYHCSENLFYSEFID
jgi:hypothetical protein